MARTPSTSFPSKISDLNCDYYGVSLHKWTFAPIGTGFLYVRKSRINETWALMASGERQDDDIRKFEEIGTHPAANHNAICEALAFNQNIGIERKAARLRYLRDRWAAPRWRRIRRSKFCTIRRPEMSVGIGMFAVVGAEQKLTAALQNKYAIYTGDGARGIHGIRVTPSVYTTLAEVDYFASRWRRN